MVHLHQHIAVRVDQWRRSDNFTCGDYPSIVEVLEWAIVMRIPPKSPISCQTLFRINTCSLSP